jgi:acyl carrier protein
MEKVENVRAKIRSYVAENILFTNKTYPYPDEASFLNEGILDSMNVLQLVMFVEKGFGFKVGDDDIVPENFDSVARLADYVLSRTAEKVP